VAAGTEEAEASYSRTRKCTYPRFSAFASREVAIRHMYRLLREHFGGGYGGQFKGGRAQLKLVPSSRTGRHRGGTHSKGELYMDSNAALFVCVKGGTPGRWKKVSTTAV
jgi:hypothetical protein